jgi:hypothetical protein
MGMKQKVINDGFKYTNPQQYNAVLLKKNGKLKTVKVPLVPATYFLESKSHRKLVWDGLNQWFDFEKLRPVHSAAIHSYIMAIAERNESELENVFFMVTEDEEIQGWVDLEIGNTSVLESAPWNRYGTQRDTVYKGVGSELRHFAILQLINRFGDDLFQWPLISRIQTLGHRNGVPDVFDPKTLDKDSIASYLYTQRNIRNSMMLTFSN